MKNSIQILEPSRQTLFLEDKKPLGKDHLYGIVDMLTKRRFALLNIAKMSLTMAFKWGYSIIYP